MPIMLLAQQVLGAADAVAETIRKIWRASRYEEHKHEAPLWWQNMFTDIRSRTLSLDSDSTLHSSVMETLQHVFGPDDPRVERALHWFARYREHQPLHQRVRRGRRVPVDQDGTTQDL